jgi:hypothetical protein
VDNLRLLRIDLYAQRLENLSRALQRRLSLAPTPAGKHPVIGIPRELVTSPAHLPIKRRQKNIAQQGGDDPSNTIANFAWDRIIPYGWPPYRKDCRE